MRVVNLLSKFTRGKRSLEDFNISIFAKQSDRVINETDNKAYNDESMSELKAKILATLKEDNSNTSPIISVQDAYHTFKEATEQHKGNEGLKAVAFHLKTKWQSSPLSYLSANDIDRLRRYANTAMPKSVFSKSSSVVETLFSTILKNSIKNRFDIKKLDKIASMISSQCDYNYSIEASGLSLNRPDMEEIRNYIVFKVNNRVGSVLVNSDDFNSVNKIAKTVSKLKGSSSFTVDMLDGIAEEDWTPTKEAKVKSEIISKAASTLIKKPDGISIEGALTTTDVAYCVSPRDGKTYIARKNIFGKYALYVKRANEDATLIDSFDSIEDLSYNVKALPKAWTI